MTETKNLTGRAVPITSGDRQKLHELLNLFKTEHVDGIDKLAEMLKVSKDSVYRWLHQAETWRVSAKKRVTHSHKVFCEGEPEPEPEQQVGWLLAKLNGGLMEERNHKMLVKICVALGIEPE